MALSSVGTHGMIVGFVAVDELQRVVEREARHDDDVRRPAMATFITTVSAKTWKNGRTPNTRSVPLPRSGLQAATCCAFT